jgi:diguanylate cyclase (GGDEF)-like protein
MPHALNHILLVEDSEDDAALLIAELARLDRMLAFRRVETAEEMAAALAERDFDLVVSDHRLPRLDSRGALAILRARSPETPFIIMSGTLAEAEAAAAMESGAQDYIDKGNRARLLPVVERELRNAGLRRAKRDIERSLVHLTYHDALTGLANRDMLAQLIERGSARRPGGQTRLALLLLDLDRFRRINDSLGHAAGDRVLAAVAARLSERFGGQATVARLGEDRFALLYADLRHAAEAAAAAEKVVASFHELFRVNGDDLSISASIGIAIHPDDESDPNELVHAAERAMRDAKQAGPGSIRRAVAQAPARAAANVRLEGALRQAAARDEFLLLHQPLIRTADRHVLGSEALIRWRHPQLGVLAPDRFLPLADELGMHGDIGRFALGAACRQAQAWAADGHDRLTVSVNVSATEFRRPGFADEVARALGESGLPGERLELEITETAVMQDAGASIAALRRLKRMGVSISIDDFGTGYSSLSYLRRLPIDILKIDRSFLSDFTPQGDNHAIVRTIVALAKALRLSTVAEGVETIEQYRLLADLAVDRAQGYLFGMPAAPASIARLAAGGPAPFLNVESSATRAA